MAYLIVFGIYLAIAIHLKLSLIYNRLWQTRKVISWGARAPKDNTKNIHGNEKILLQLEIYNQETIDEIDLIVECYASDNSIILTSSQDILIYFWHIEIKFI